MLSVGEDVEASALSRRGWSISAIARHLDRDRKTVRSYLAGERVPGVRRPAGPDSLASFAAYVAARFADDPHLWASALFDEVIPLGYDRSYVSFARQLRLAGLRRIARHAQGLAAGRRSRSATRRVRRSSGTGSSGAGRRGPGPRTCCPARCRTRAGPAVSWPGAWIRRIWPGRWTR
jgi:hypothetical protein